MPTYAPQPAFAERGARPKTLTIIVAVHAVLIASVMAAKMDLPSKFTPTPTKVELIPLPKEPPPPPPPQPQIQPKTQPSTSAIDRPVTIVPTPPIEGPQVDSRPMPLPDPGPVIGNGIEPAAEPAPIPTPVRTGPRFATPASDLRPPYPPQKLRSEEEAVLKLRLSIDERGRVTAVEPVGRVDPVFFAAARKHLIARWKYEPATDGGRAVPSSTVISLRFQLD